MKHNYGSVTFYITNVCNLNCEHCSYLNNYPVKGHQRWIDNKDSCIAWSKKIDPAVITILGGEPMVNPDFLSWVTGLAEIWPNTEIRINTNGTCFDRWPDLYDICKSSQGRINISISGHNEYTKTKEIDTIKNFLQGKVTIQKNDSKIFRKWIWNKIYNRIKDTTWPDVLSIDDYNNLPDHILKEVNEVHHVYINDYIMNDEPTKDYEVYVDENDVRVGWARWDEFDTSAVKFDSTTQVLNLHDSNPEKAVSICHGGHCSYIKDGKWYKCQVMGILPDMFKQNFPFNISPEDKELILSYQPALPSWDFQQLETFFEGLSTRKAIPQCKFCPEYKESNKIHADTKKIKIIPLGRVV